MWHNNTECPANPTAIPFRALADDVIDTASFGLGNDVSATLDAASFGGNDITDSSTLVSDSGDGSAKPAEPHSCRDSGL